MNTLRRRPLVLLALAVAALALGLWLISKRPDPAAIAATPEPSPLPALARPLPDHGDARAPERAERGSLAPGVRALVLQSDPVHAPGRVAGRVEDQVGRPVAGATCTLLRGRPAFGLADAEASGADAGAGAAPLASARSAADGTFELAAPPGALRLAVARDGYAPWSEDGVRAGERRVVRLTPAAPLRVRAEDAGGAPLEDVDVAVLGGSRDLDARPLARARTDARGEALLGPVRAGEWWLAARHPERRLVVQPLAVGAGGPPEDPVVVVLERGVRLVGRVVAPGGLAPDAARVRVEAFSRGHSLVLEPPCDGAGAFATDAVLVPNETIWITASGAGFAEVETGRRVPATPESGELELELEVVLELAAREARARGRVVDERGVPVACAALSLVTIAPTGRGMGGFLQAIGAVTPHAERWRPAGRSREDGTFELARLGGGVRATLRAVAPGRAPGFAWVPPVEPGAAAELGDVVLEPTSGVFGFVRDEGGEPLAGHRVQAVRELLVEEFEHGGARPSQWWRPLETTTQEDGSFRFDDVGPGFHDLFVEWNAAGNWYFVPGRALGPVELTVPRALVADEGEQATLEGVVRGAGGAPVEHAFVALFDDALGPPGEPGVGPAPVALTIADALGRFELDVPRGTFCTLRVSDVRGAHRAHEQALEPWEETRALDVRLETNDEPRAPLVGLVLGPDGSPLAGIDVALEPPENRYCNCLALRARTDASGVVEFPNVSAADHRAVFTDPQGRFRAAEHAPVRAGGYFEVMLEE